MVEYLSAERNSGKHIFTNFAQHEIMKTCVFLLLFFACASHALGPNDCCKLPTKLYEELKCMPIYDYKSTCCPSRYDCREYEYRSRGTCFLLGRAYSDGNYVSKEITNPNCLGGCRCQGETFNCGQIDCPPWRPRYSGCIAKYEADKCCPVGEICPPFDDFACFANGMYYRESEHFIPNFNKKFRCTCQKGFAGILEKPYCVKDDCLTELRFSAQIKQFCAPVYQKLGRDEKPNQCPIDFLCSIPRDAQRTYLHKESAEQCKFGRDVLKKGETVRIIEHAGSSTTYTTQCECHMPPFATCMRTITAIFNEV